MSPDDGAVDEMDAPVQPSGGILFLLDGRQQPVPDPGQPPAAEPAVDGAPGAVPLRQVAPGGAGAELPEDAVEEEAVVLGRLAGLRLLGRQQRGQPSPLRLGEVATMNSHTKEYRANSDFAHTP
jgi:hypothetical protein